MKARLPLWSPFDISREHSWELIFPEFHLHILLEEGAVNRSQKAVSASMVAPRTS